MARTIDTTVTGNLSAIIRLMETGPKICQKYIEQPALFKGRKFDIRYIVLVRSINPLELFITDVFWVCKMKPKFFNFVNLIHIFYFLNAISYRFRLGLQTIHTLWIRKVCTSMRHISLLW